MDLLAGPARDGLLVLAGLGWAAVAAGRLLFRPRLRVPALTRADGLFLWVPHVLVAVPFFLAGAAYALWVPAVTAVALVLGHHGRRLTRCDDGSIRGPVLAVLTGGTLLLQFGLLLAVRLVVAPDPRVRFSAALGADNLRTAWSVLIQPLLGLLIVIVALHFRNRIRLFPKRLPQWPPGWIAPAVAAPFLLPLLTGAGGPALTLGPIATPEYGKLLLCGALAVLVARDGYRFHDVRLFRSLLRIHRAPGGLWRRPALVASYRASRFLLVPIALFGLVAVASGLRHDFGTIVPAALITMGVTWSATRYNIDRDRVAGEPEPPAVRLVLAYRLFIGIAVVLIGGMVTLFGTNYVGERGRVWSDPWRFRWDAACVIVAVPPDVAVPPGRVACLRSLKADAESEDSQLARALAATADGGLWGNGVRDRVSGQVSAGATDFVLAVVWNKLGALVVIAAGALTLILAAGLVRAAEHDRTARLFAAGLGAMIAGQYLFVLATTANVVPHTGIPAPLLSRGGQSTLALLIGVVIVLAGARRSMPATAAPRRVVSTTATAGVLGGIVVVLTLVPYAAPAGLRVYSQRRPLCPGRPADRAGLETDPPDPRTCSTDRIALARTRVALTFPGDHRLVLDRPTHRWEPDQPGGLTGDDVAGLTGQLESDYPGVTGFSAGARLSRRLLPPERDRVDGGLALTLDADLQHALAVAARGDVPASVAVLDLTDGRVLARADNRTTRHAPPVDDETAEDFAGKHPYYVRPEPGDLVHDSERDPSCVRRSRDGGGQKGCWRLSYTEPDPPAADPGPTLDAAAGAGAVAQGGRPVRPRLVDSVTYPATGITEKVPTGPEVAAPDGVFPGSYLPVDGLRLRNRADGSAHWSTGWAEPGTVAFAVRVDTPDAAVADDRTGRILAALRTWIGDR
ncbi:FtsW/RodA/SpoVE family cell cycle protein [Actinoplanes sp. HUAS TT8]|uniref:FtsW/RodA/SpoVE family cell cycle protein n=1 Tax=Actinoplanes sp. HUAS TT8 TaxID=3447453 RepID=UPI003F520D89